MIRVAFGLLLCGFLSFSASPSVAQTASPQDLALCRYFKNQILCRCVLENGGEIRPNPEGRGYILYGQQSSRGGYIDGQARCTYRAEQRKAAVARPPRSSSLPSATPAKTRRVASDTHPPAIRLEDVSSRQGRPAAERSIAAPAAPVRQAEPAQTPVRQPGSVVIGPYRQLPQVIYVQYDRPGGVVYVPYVGTGK